MFRRVTILFLLAVLILSANVLFAQRPVPIQTATLIDTSIYNGIYRGVQTQFFCEPNTGYLIFGYYDYNSSDPDPRRITAATSLDGGETWTTHTDINFGVGTVMDARYATVWGTSMTPIVAYSDRNPDGPDQDSRPVVAYDVVGWGGGVFDNIFVDNSGSPDTTLYGRYLSLAVAPDNDNLWAVGCYHSPTPGQAYYYYFSEDAGINWSRPKVPMSEVEADMGKPNYVYDLTSRGMGVGLGYNNTVMVSGAAKFEKDEDIWNVIYSTSTDAGRTWSPVSKIPGSEHLYCSDADNYRNYSSPMLDAAGNWHIFVVAYDTTESSGSFPTPYYGYDFRYDGSTWNVTKIAMPRVFENGIAAWGDYPADVEQHQMNEPSLGPDGTLYYTYTDLIDTTGFGGDLDYANFNMMVMYSEDNGDTWKGPVSILDKWRGHQINGAARFTTCKLHVIYHVELSAVTGEADELWYMGVPTDTIKALATSVENKVAIIKPTSHRLNQNYPNPFNPTTNITFDLKERVHVTLKIYNQIGQEVATLIDKTMDAGYKGITWHTEDVSSGVYFCKLTAGDYTATQRMIISK